MFPQATFIFQGDKLMSQDPRVVRWGIRFYRDSQGLLPAIARSFEWYTVVTLSAQPDPQGYVNLTAFTCCVDHQTHIGWLLPESAIPLSESQAKTAREWLLRRDPLAWEHAGPEVRSLVNALEGNGRRDGLHGDSPSVQPSVVAWVGVV